jgi:hypothetical protein
MRRWAVLAAVAAIGLCGASQAPQSQTAGHEQAANHQAPKAAQTAVPIPPVEPKQAAEYPRPCRKPKDAAESELCAQWQAADAASDSVKWARYQTLLGVLGAIGLIWTLIYTARGTRAAVEAVEAQISSDRPLMQMSTATANRIGLPELGEDGGGKGGGEIKALWNLMNYGATGCWVEEVCITYSTNPPPADPRQTDKVRKLSAFLPPGKGFGTVGQFERIAFDEGEFAQLRESRRLYIFGYSVYRDTGGRRWRTGFAGQVLLNTSLQGNGFAFYPSDVHWVDERIYPKRGLIGLRSGNDGHRHQNS